MKYKNYYKILGLKNDKATEEEIKSAYRKLAKKYHPDMNGGDESVTENFKEVNEAYHVLGDASSRKKYDRTYFAYKFKDGFSFDNAKSTIKTESGIKDMFSMVFGLKEEPNVKTNLDKNDDYPITGENLESKIDITLEEAFFGNEKKIAFKNIKGNMCTILVKIPRGIHNGEKIRIPGMGKPGKNGGENGDLFLKVNILEHNKFKIDGSNLILDLPLSPWEAALGCKVEIQNIDSNLLVDVPSNSTSGDKILVKNMGYLNTYGLRGDLLLNVKVMLPKTLTKEEENLFKELKKISKYSPREE